MKELSTSFCLSNGWALFKKYGLTLSAITLAYYAIQQMTCLPLTIARVMADPSINGAYYGYGAQPMFMQGTSIMLMIPCTLISALITYVFSFGFIGMIMRLTAGTLTSVSFSPFKQPIITYLKFIAVYIICGLAISVGCLICLVPGIYLAVKLNFVPYYILDHPEASIDEALTVGWRMTSGNFWNILGMLFTCVGVVIVGFLLCCIGMVAAVPLCYFIESTAYYELLGNIEPERSSEYDKHERTTFI